VKCSEAAISNMNINRLSRYQEGLRGMPPSGGGGCHTALLRVANFGQLAGVDPDQVANDLASHVHGTRNVTETEIRMAVDKAFNGQAKITSNVKVRTQTPHPMVDGAKLLAGIEARGADFGEVELWEASPVRIEWPPERDAFEVLRLLYAPEDRLFIVSLR
jgi:hypothetical protein